MSKLIDLTGQKFGRLIVIKRVENNKQGHPQYLCKCDCKNEKIIAGASLRRGATQSCGCLNKNIVSKLFKKYNTYDLSGEYGIGYTDNKKEFYFDLEDYDKIKDYYWGINKKGYITTNLHNDDNIINLKMHRLVMNCPEGFDVDHIYHINHDNRKSELRIVTRNQNTINVSLSSKNTSGITGVSWNSRYDKWQTQIQISGKRKHLGYFINKEDAIKARLEAEKKYFGEFAPQKHLYEKYGISS